MTDFECERARRHLADPVAGPPDAQTQQHLLACAACAEEMRVTRAVLDAAAEFRTHDVPDPGPAYWDRFLPSVRARIARREQAATFSSRHPRRIAAAAASLMILLAAGALFLPAPIPGPERFAGPDGTEASLEEAGRRMDDALRRMPEAGGEVAADMIGLDPFQQIDAGEILDAMKEIDADDELERLLDKLDMSETLKLRAELAAEKG